MLSSDLLSQAKKELHTRKHTHTCKATRAHLPLTQENLPVTTSSVTLWSLFTCLRCFWPTKHRFPSPTPPPAGIYRHMALCKALRTDVLLLSFLTDILGEWVIFFSFIAFHRTTLRGCDAIRVCSQTGNTPSRIKCYHLPVWLFNAVELQPNKYCIVLMEANLPSFHQMRRAALVTWTRMSTSSDTETKTFFKLTNVLAYKPFFFKWRQWRYKIS